MHAISSLMKIDFVSDVSCPWCAIGLMSLDIALSRLKGQLTAELHFQPFELNPHLPPEGQDIHEHLTQKYGSSPQEQARNREMIRERGEAVGFIFGKDKRKRVYNTFDAHRLLHWAGLNDRAQQKALKLALLKAYFTDGEDPSDHLTLLRIAGNVGLDKNQTREILAAKIYTDDVRALEHQFQELGIRAVPSVIIDDRHLIQGGQPPETFERALRQIAGLT